MGEGPRELLLSKLAFSEHLEATVCVEVADADGVRGVVADEGNISFTIELRVVGEDGTVATWQAGFRSSTFDEVDCGTQMGHRGQTEG